MWKAANPYYYRMLQAVYYFLQRFWTIGTLIANIYVIQSLMIGNEDGLAAAVAVMVVGQVS
jgi:hypothetical protein